MPNKPHWRTFEITKDDIANGIARHSQFCPIAEVIQRTLPDVQYVLVDLATIRWSDPVKRKRYVFTTPKIAQQFIVDFDWGHNERLKPFTLKLMSAIQIVDMRTNRIRDRTKEYAKAKAQRTARKYTVKVNARGHATKIGGRLPPTVASSNIQRVRRFGVRALTP